MKKETSQKDAWFLYALALLFIALKLTGFIDWSWWWVTAPLWGGAAVVLAITCGWLLFNAKLFRGGMNVDKFTDDEGRTLTLAELKSLDNITL